MWSAYFTEDTLQTDSCDHSFSHPWDCGVKDRRTEVSHGHTGGFLVYIYIYINIDIYFYIHICIYTCRDIYTDVNTYYCMWSRYSFYASIWNHFPGDAVFSGMMKFISEIWCFSMRRPLWKTKFPLSQSKPRKTNMDTQNDGLERGGSVMPLCHAEASMVWKRWFLTSGNFWYWWCMLNFWGGKFLPQRSGGFISWISPLQYGPEKHQNLGSNSLRLGFLDPFGPSKTQLMKLNLQQNSWGSWSVMKNIPLKYLRLAPENYSTNFTNTQ